MSTEVQRATWREKARERREAKKAAATPRSGDPPAFLRVDTQEVFSIATNDGADVCLNRDELEELYRWWKVKRKSK